MIRDRIGRRVKALLNRGSTRQVQQDARKPARRERDIAALRAMLAERDASEDVGIRPENIIWIFGSARTGSSWLTYMMRALPNHSRWNEPLVGYLFGHLYYEGAWTRQDDKQFILGNDYEEIWLSSLRSVVLKGATARFPERADKGYLVIKEPHGSIGAPLLMKALPESRMIFLVRDPRDVVASKLDAHKEGSWASKQSRTKLGEDATDKQPDAFAREQVKTYLDEIEKRPDAFVREQARIYLRDLRFTIQAYEAHKGHKVLVRYEDLRTDTLETMKRIYSALEIPVSEGDLVRAIEKHAWENVPEDKKGPGKIRRKATPGGWREDLTPEQVAIVERETAQILDQFYAKD